MRTIASALAATVAVCVFGYLALFSALPANSAEAPAPTCQFILPDATAQLDAQGITYHVLDAEERASFLLLLPEDIAPKVTDVLLALLEGKLFFGLVIDGCLSPPQPLAMLTPAVGHLSGKTMYGTFA